MATDYPIAGPCPCCGGWWCLKGTPPGCLSIRLGAVTGDPPCPDCSGPSVGGSADPHPGVYTLCPEIGGSYSGDGATFYEDPMSPGDWLLEACGITFSFVAFTFPPPGAFGVVAVGGPVAQPGPCVTVAGATIYVAGYRCYEGTYEDMLGQLEIEQSAPTFNYYGYSGPYASEEQCELNCPAGMEGLMFAERSSEADPPVPSKERKVVKRPDAPPGPSGLGDKTANVLSKIGVTEERVKKAVSKLTGGRVKDCGCGKRKELLNELGKKIGVGVEPPKVE